MTNKTALKPRRLAKDLEWPFRGHDDMSERDPLRPIICAGCGGVRFEVYQPKLTSPEYWYWLTGLNLLGVLLVQIPTMFGLVAGMGLVATAMLGLLAGATSDRLWEKNRKADALASRRQSE